MSGIVGIMNITIHRGSREIGGTCIELSTTNTRILLDAGLPLASGSASIDLARIAPDAAIISHPQQDHYGMITDLPDNVPVYIGKLAKELLDATRIFLQVPLHSNTFRTFEAWQSFRIGDFQVTPYLMDHSAVDAFGLLVEAEGKRLFYSGDFRGHGKKRGLFEAFVKKPPTGIDLLFMEGTMMERTNDDFPSEDAVQQRIGEIVANQQNISFLISSSQNVDRLVSAYNACVAADKVFVIDFYTAWVLEKVKSISAGVRAMDLRRIAVLRDGRSAGRQYGIMANDRSRFAGFMNEVFKRAITLEQLHARPDRYLMLAKLGPTTSKRVASFIADTPVNIIYSQWLGYLKSDLAGYTDVGTMNAYRDGEVAGVCFHYAHTSGHATVQDLQRFAKSVNPKVLIPIHTEYGHRYSTVFDNVVMHADGKAFEL